MVVCCKKVPGNLKIPGTFMFGPYLYSKTDVNSDVLRLSIYNGDVRTILLIFSKIGPVATYNVMRYNCGYLRSPIRLADAFDDCFVS